MLEVCNGQLMLAHIWMKWIAHIWMKWISSCIPTLHMHTQEKGQKGASVYTFLVHDLLQGRMSTRWKQLLIFSTNQLEFAFFVLKKGHNFRIKPVLFSFCEQNCKYQLLHVSLYLFQSWYFHSHIISFFIPVVFFHSSINMSYIICKSVDLFSYSIFSWVMQLFPHCASEPLTFLWVMNW